MSIWYVQLSTDQLTGHKNSFPQKRNHKCFNPLTANLEHIRAKNTSAQKRNYKYFQMESDKGKRYFRFKQCLALLGLGLIYTKLF